MAIWRDHLLPRIIDKACGRREFSEARRRTVGGLHGQVIEIGFGSGHNLAHYPATVERIMAVEPSAVARRLAEPRIAATSLDVDFVGLDSQHLTLPNDCADAAVTTFTLCSLPDVIRALRELARVLRPGGRLHFLEHGLSPDPKVVAWQHRLTPLQKRVCGGCHFDRPITELLTAAGFNIVALENFYFRGPKTPSYMYQGVAQSS
jgi:ubiquinone/menaquinone biosynthesis C-methylase UbiE